MRIANWTVTCEKTTVPMSAAVLAMTLITGASSDNVCAQSTCRWPADHALASSRSLSLGESAVHDAGHRDSPFTLANREVSALTAADKADAPTVEPATDPIVKNVTLWDELSSPAAAALREPLSPAEHGPDITVQ